MEANHLSVAPGGGPPSTGPILVRRQGAGPVPGIFREVRHLRFSPGQGAEELVIDADGCELEGRFLPYSYNAIPPGAGDLRASVTNPSGGQGLIVTLDAPRRVRAIVFNGSIDLPAPHTLHVHRLDGNTPTEEPSVTAPVASHAFVDAVFTGAVQHGTVNFVGGVGPGAGAINTGMYAMTSTGSASPASGTPGASNMSAISSVQAVGSIPVSGQFTGVFAEEHTVIAGISDVAFNIDFTDRRFLVRVRGANGQFANLAPSRLSAVSVEAYPRSARIGLAFPTPAGAADPLTANIFWRAPGEIGNGAPLAAGEVDEGPSLGAELKRAAARYLEQLRDGSAEDGPPPTLPPTLDVAVVIESDAPCRFALESVRIPYRMARESFADGSEKQVLRFGARQVETRELAIPIPAGATIHSADLVTVESLRGDRTGTMAEGQGATRPIGPARTGIRIHPQMRAAQRLTPARASVVSGLLVGVTAVDPGIVARVELREDADGAPTGRLLGSGTIEMDAPGRPAWQMVRFEEAVIIPTSAHWIVLASDAGAIVWLTTATDEDGEAVHLLRNEGSGSWVNSHLAHGRRTLHTLLNVGGATPDGPAFELTIGGVALPPGVPEGDRMMYDMTGPAAAFLAGPSGRASSDILMLPVHCSALGPGSVTVYPPRIEFDR